MSTEAMSTEELTSQATILWLRLDDTRRNQFMRLLERLAVKDPSVLELLRRADAGEISTADCLAQM